MYVTHYDLGFRMYLSILLVYASADSLLTVILVTYHDCCFSVTVLESFMIEGRVPGGSQLQSFTIMYICCSIFNDNEKAVLCFCVI